MRKFRKKPVVVHAEQLTKEAIDSHVLDGTPLPDGCRITRSQYHRGQRRVDFVVVRIANQDHDLIMPGDWVVRDVDGAYFVCHPDIFADTYEPEIAP